MDPVERRRRPKPSDMHLILNGKAAADPAVRAVVGRLRAADHDVQVLSPR